MKSLISFSLLLGVICLSPVRGQETPSQQFTAAYEGAIEVQENLFTIQQRRLVDFYVGHLETLARDAQANGDLEGLIVIKKEQELAQEGGEVVEESDIPALQEAKSLYLDQISQLKSELADKQLSINKSFLEKGKAAVSELTRQNRMKEANDLNELLSGIETKVLAAQPAPPTPVPKKPEPPSERLGPNILTDGSLDEAVERHWRFTRLALNTKGGIYQEPNSGRNKTIRLKQHDQHTVYVMRNLKIKHGKTYRITWRARLLRPWRSGIELRGKGSYSLGIKIPGSVWAALTPVQQTKVRHTSSFRRPLPDDREWRTYSGTLKAQPLQSELILSLSSGEGEMLFDDIRIQEVLPPKEPKPKK